jgi:Fe-S cluster assembly ATP-binding protein
MGHPGYEIVQGDILLDGNSIRDMQPDERAQAGIFLAFQTIPEIKGVKLFEFLRTIYNTTHGTKESFVTFKKIILPILDELGIDKEFLRRDLNVGFSGGERRKVEILQLKLLKPRYVFLDEVDSGLDVDAFRAVAQLLQQVSTSENSFIIITHYFTILDYLGVDEVIVLAAGEVTAR